MDSTGRKNAARVPRGGGVKPNSARAAARKRRRKRRLRLSLALLVVFACAVFVVLSLTVLFRVANFVVEGDLGSYTDAQLTEASGIQAGVNLFFVDTAAAEAKIEQALPYIKTAKVRIRLPDRVRITVEQAQPVALLETSGGWVRIAADSKVLGPADASDSYPKVIHAQATSVLTGQAVTFERADTVRILSELFAALQAHSPGEVTTIDLTDLYALTIQCRGLYTLRLGSTADLEHKLSFAAYIIENKLEPGQAGTLDLSVNNDQIIFRPDYGSSHTIVLPGAQAASSGSK